MELFSDQRHPELGLEQQSLDGRGVHLRGVEDLAITAGAFRVVHGCVGIADQVDDVVAVLRARGNADARGDLELVPTHVLRPRDLGQQQPGQRRGLFVAIALPGRGLGKYREFVPGKATDHGLLRQDAAEALAQRLENTVTCVVAEGVVDFLEVVQVQVQQGERSALSQRPGDRLLQQVLELHAIRHLGQRVEARQVTDAPLRPLAIGDVAQDVDVALEPGVVARDCRRGNRHRNGLAAGRAHDGLARCLEDADRVEGRAVLLRDQRREVEAGELPGLVSEQDLCRAIGGAYAPVGGHHQHGVAHAVQQDTEVVAGYRRAGQCLAHSLQCILDRRNLANAT